MTQEINQLQSFTVEEFQKNFDVLMNRVESGESFILRHGNKSAVIVPYNEVVNCFIEQNQVVDDEVVRLHTDHEEGS
jgi:antitoxin (DNA-binding transcriptional repressor) of toxin-antitoxin stability system